MFRRPVEKHPVGEARRIPDLTSRPKQPRGEEKKKHHPQTAPPNPYGGLEEGRPGQNPGAAGGGEGERRSQGLRKAPPPSLPFPSLDGGGGSQGAIIPGARHPSLPLGLPRVRCVGQHEHASGFVVS